jgi:Tfp pilus assembly protein PilN
VSKPIEHVLLIPGEETWEVWSGTGETGFEARESFATATASGLADLPPGELTMFFPVKSLTAVPLRVTSEDESLFADLAALHAERLGLRPDPMAGQLTDVFVITREAENTALLSVFLKSPSPEELPPRSPNAFDISPRAFQVDGDSLAIWKEFGRWVFALYHQGKLAYCQATSVDARLPDAALAREIRLSLAQLSMQGLDADPVRAHVWASLDRADIEPFAQALNLPTEPKPRPLPVPPSPLSKLLPADVRAARRTAQRRRAITLAAAAAALAYLGLIGWFLIGLWQTSYQTRKLKAQAEKAAPDIESYTLHAAKWDELAHAIDRTHAPVDILSRIASCIPPNSGLRLKIADVSATEIKLTGEAPQIQAVNSFSLNLTKHNGLTQFDWQTPQPNQSNRGWEFVFTGELPIEETQE